MKKRFKKLIVNIVQSPWTKVILYIGAMVGVLFLAGAFENGDYSKDFLQTGIDLIKNPETISFLFVGLVTVGASIVMKIIAVRVEEDKKIADDHHEIICKYDGHRKNRIRNFIKENHIYCKAGIFMQLRHSKDRLKIRNYFRDKFSSEHLSLQKEINDYYKDGTIYLPTVNVYTNLGGNCRVSFDDSTQVKELPPFVVGNGTEFLKAHRYSQTTNNLTIRLNDFSCNDNNEITLHTGRTYYYHMLLTNRCMDFKLDCDMSVREIYEFNKTISPLDESKLSNQIGINGLIITKDGYLLLEKRDRKKTTWKNKFAQPISLALKANDLGFDNKKKITSNEEGNTLLVNVLKKTIKENFGLVEKDYQTITLDENFLGLARDLLEGGKPNLYFYVVVNYTAKELAAKIEENARIIKETEDGVKPLKTGKLSSKYYLVHHDKISIDFNYNLKLLRKDVIKVRRVLKPRCSGFKQFCDTFGYKVGSLFSKYLSYDCGEALLVCISYFELCEGRIIENGNAIIKE